MKNKVLMLCAAIAWGIVSAFAETCTVDGVTYSYQVTDGEAQITDVPSSTSGDLLVPARLSGIPVTSVGSHAFSDCKAITSIVFSEGLRSIVSGAFVRSSNLKSVVLPDGVENIGADAFEYCSGLSYIVMPDTVTTIEGGAFASCKGLSALKLPSELTCIERDLFIYCSGLKTIQFPSGLQEIGDGAFAACKGLTSVTLPETVEKVEDDVFLWDSGLSEVVFKGPPPKDFNSGAFTYCGTVKGYYLEEYKADWQAALGSSSSWNGLGMSQVSAESDDSESSAHIEYANLKGAAHTNPTSFKKGDTVAFTTPGHVEGYTFAGWSPQVITADMTNDQVVTANWFTNRYEIAYDPRGGVGEMKSTACRYDQDVAISSNVFVRTGYDFMGWATNKNGLVVLSDGAVVSNLTSLADDVVTLYAVWKSQGVRISNLKATSIPPWGLAIDYDLVGVEGMGTSWELEISAAWNGGSCTAKTLSGDCKFVDGAHRAYWNMAQDGLTLDEDQLTLSVGYKHIPCEGSPYCIIDLSHGAGADARYPVTYMDVPPSGGFNTQEYKTMKLVLKCVDSGSFIMGEDQSNEAHRVTLTRAFYMGIFEVTQAQWERVMGANPSYFASSGCETRPVEMVSYSDIRGSVKGAKWPLENTVDEDSFLGRLREKTGTVEFDLPTEAQWEYACRAGSMTKYNYGDVANGDYMWYSDNNDSSGNSSMWGTKGVGLKKPNAWGLYDMHGNLWECCLDWVGELKYGIDPIGPSSRQSRVLKGGCWDNWADDLLGRAGTHPLQATNCQGFRLAWTLRTNGHIDGANVPTLSTCCACRVVPSCAKIKGSFKINYAPCGTTNAVVAVNGEEIVNSDVEGTLTWRPTESGDYTLTHTVGDVVLSATYHVTLPQIEVDDGTGGIGGADSRFSYSGTYDGEGHGISVVVPEDVADATVAYALAKDGPYVAENPFFTNACEATTVWYTISASGYVTYTNSATVAITKRPVTITSGTKTDFVYDGNPHGFSVIAISGTGFVAGEGIVTSNWATVTTVAQGEVANTFDYAAAAGTDLANYDITTSFGTLAVTKRKIVAENADGAVDSSSASTYNGYLYDDEETPVGTIQAKVAKARLNRRTRQWSSSVTVAILIAGEKKISLRGTLDVESGAISLKAKDGRALDLQLGANGMSGAFGDYVIDGARDVFSSKTADDKVRANAALAKWQGALTIVSDTGTFSVTIYSKGKTRITGTLANGTKISASAQMIVGETCSCIPVVVSTKSVNLAFCIWLGDDGETVEVVGLGEDVVCGRPGALADGAAFRIDVAAFCELLGDDTFAAYLPDGVSVVQKGTKWIVADGARTGRVVLGKSGEVDEAKAGANPSALRFSYRAKDGTFTGSFKAYVLYRGRPKATTVTVSGVVIDGVGYGTATIRKMGSVPIRIE